MIPRQFGWNLAGTEPTCSACRATLPPNQPDYRDDEGRPLCASCYWRAASA
jgi:hypothetical protein